MGNSYNVFIWAKRGEEWGGFAGEPYWKEVYYGESFIKALFVFLKYFRNKETGCVKLEGRP